MPPLDRFGFAADCFALVSYSLLFHHMMKWNESMDKRAKVALADGLGQVQCDAIPLARRVVHERVRVRRVG